MHEAQIKLTLSRLVWLQPPIRTIKPDGLLFLSSLLLIVFELRISTRIDKHESLPAAAHIARTWSGAGQVGIGVLKPKSMVIYKWTISRRGVG